MTRGSGKGRGQEQGTVVGRMSSEHGLEAGGKN